MSAAISRICAVTGGGCRFKKSAYKSTTTAGLVEALRTAMRTHGVPLAARNELLEALHRTFNSDPKRAGFFTTVVFEQKQDAALSWFLTTAQKKQVAEGYHELKDGSWRVNEQTRQVVLVSCIDNLVKGAAGQAVQNFNVAFGFDERLGLN